MPAEIIYLEGSKYSGKTEMMQRLWEHFTTQGKNVKCFIEPGSDNSASMAKIREILLDKNLNNETPLCYLTRRLLYAASYAQTLSMINQIKDEFDYIIIDRHTSVSDFIYGPMSVANEDFHHAFQISMNLLDAHYHASCMGSFDFKAHSTLVMLQINNTTLKTRALKRENNETTKKDDMYDNKDLDFRFALNDKYNQFILHLPTGKYRDMGVVDVNKAIIIDANSPVDIVFKDLLYSLKHSIGRYNDDRFFTP